MSEERLQRAQHADKRKETETTIGNILEKVELWKNSVRADDLLVYDTLTDKASSVLCCANKCALARAKELCKGTARRCMLQYTNCSTSTGSTIMRARRDENRPGF